MCSFPFRCFQRHNTLALFLASGEIRLLRLGQMTEISILGELFSHGPLYKPFPAPDDAHSATWPPFPEPVQNALPGRLKPHFLSFSTFPHCALSPSGKKNRMLPCEASQAISSAGPLTIIKSIEGKIIETLSRLMELGHRQLGSHFCKSVTQFSSPFTTQRSGAASHVSIVCGKCHRQR